MQEKKPRLGRRSLFRGKIREKPLTITATPRHHRLVEAGMRRLGLTRSDFLALLIERYADTVTLQE